MSTSHLHTLVRALPAIALLLPPALTVMAADIQLPLVASGAKDSIRAYMPQSASTSAKQPVSVTKLPANLVAPVFGQFKFGPKESPMTIVFAFDDPPGQPARLLIDANGNGDLTDDPAPEWAMRDMERNGKPCRYGEGKAMLYLAKGDEASKVRLNLYRFVGSEPSMRGDLQYYPDYARIGKVELDGKTYAAILHDEYASGDFRHLATTLKLDLNGNGRFDTSNESFRTANPFKIGDTAYEVTGITTNGDSFQIGKTTRPVPEVKPRPAVAAAVVRPGQPAPKFEATTITGQKISLPGSYQGKLVLIDFWATWCGPCIGELPHLIKAYETHHANGLEVLGISLDSEKTVATLPEFLKAKNMTWPQVCDGKGWSAEIGRLYGVRAIPAAFLIDGTTGIVLATQGLRGTQLSDTIQATLSKKLTPENAGNATATRKPVSFLDSTLTGSKWSGGANFWIEFRANGDYREFWRGGEYPGTWKVLNEQEVSMERKDGWDYVFKPVANGNLLRVWQPKPGQEQQQDISFQPMAVPGASPVKPATAESDEVRHIKALLQIYAKDREQAVKVALEGLEKSPTEQSWGQGLEVIFQQDEFRGKRLRGEERIQFYQKCREYLMRGGELCRQALERHPKHESLALGLEVITNALALASLETGETAGAKKLAQSQLAANTNTTSWNHGNIIHKANALLGRAALRDGDKKTAVDFLMKAGATPGSPQLNSFGPDFTFAREMLEAGETQAVLDYFDLVQKFWVDKKTSSALSQQVSDRNKQKLDQWRAEVSAGKVPDFRP